MFYFYVDILRITNGYTTRCLNIKLFRLEINSFYFSASAKVVQ
jgi:hypothetical protein